MLNNCFSNLVGKTYFKTKLLSGLIIVFLVCIKLYTLSSALKELSSLHHENVVQLMECKAANDRLTSIDEGVTYQIPPVQELEQMSSTDLMNIYWKYINRIQILCKDVIRVGTLQDGGKEVCVDKPYRPKAPCIVYSFGINFQFDFENDVVEMFGCDVFTFDPSMNKGTSKISEHIWFYNWGLAGGDTVNNQGWQLKTLSTIRKELGHANKTIDILKIDIEGDEWNATHQMISSGALENVIQILMETHFLSPRPSSPLNWGSTPGHLQLSALGQLHHAGYRIFMRDRNMGAIQQWPSIKGFITTVNEISLVRPLK